MADKDNLSKHGINYVPTGLSDFEPVWSSHDAGFAGRGASENIDSNTMSIINNNARHVSADQVPGTEVPIWQQARASTFSGNYPQQVLSQLESVNLKRDGFVFMDLEALGTLSANVAKGERLGFVAPTEIAMQHTKIGYNGRARILNDVNMVVSPGRHYKSLDTLLKTLEANPLQASINMSADERRSLEDLILYSNADNFGETTVNGKKIKTIVRQARGAQPIGAASLANATTIQKMRVGLRNLQTMATDPITAIEVMTDFFEQVTNQTPTGGQVRIAGQNIRSYDLPVLHQMINENMVGKHKYNPKLKRALDLVNRSNYIDTLQVERTLNRNIATKYPNLKLSTLAESRKVLNYKGKYIQPGVSAAHFAPYDVEMNGRVFASQLRQFRDLQKKGVPLDDMRKGFQYISYNNKNLTVGDRLFAMSGMSGYEAGKYDMVYDSSFKPISTLKGMNPLYRNATYNIKNFGVQDIAGKSMYTMTLFNEDRDTYHFFARNSLDELQNIVHKNMDYVPGVSPNDHSVLARLSAEDSALRRYNKMFSTEGGGGINLYTRYSNALKAYERSGNLSEAERVARLKQAGGYTNPDGVFVHANDSFVRDFLATKDRFAQEKIYFDPFIDMMKKDSTLKGNKEAQNIALSIYKDKLDAQFGRNMRTLSGEQIQNSVRSILPFDIDGAKVNVQVSNDIDAIQMSLNRAIGHGNVSKNMTTNSVKGRLLQVVNQLRAKDHITGNVAKDIIGAIRGLKNDESAWHVMRDVSVAINNAHNYAAEKGKVFGLQTIDVEDPTKLVDERAKNLKNGFRNSFTQLAHDTLQQTQVYTGRAYNGINIPQGSRIDALFAQHDKVMNELVKHPRLAGAQVGKHKSARAVLDRLVKSYVNPKGNTGSTLFYGGRDELVLAVYDKKFTDQVKGMNYEQIMKNNNIVTMNIPLLRENQNLRYGTQERIGRLKVETFNGKSQLVTGFEEVVRSYSNVHNKVVEMISQGKAIDATNFLRGIGRSTLENLSQNRTKARRDAFDDPFRVQESRGANWARRGTVDFSGMAETWWKEQYGATHGQTYDKIMQKMRDNPRMPFVEAMSGMQVEVNGRREDPGLRWALGMEDWLKEKGFNVDSHSIKNTLVNNDVRSFNDVGELMPFGNYNAAVREKHFKVLNYLPLDENMVAENLTKSGYGKADIERMMRLGTTTDRGMEVFGNEVNYLSMRTGYASTARVAQELKNPLYSTSEGMFILRKELASAFTVNETKFAALSEGATLSPELQKLFGNADLSQNITLDNPMELRKLINGKNPALDYSKEKGLTVGGLMKTAYAEDGLAAFDVDPVTGERSLKKNFHATDYYKDLHVNNTRIVGWNAERQALVMSVTRNLEDGDKMLGSGGLRGTVTLVPGAELDKTAFAGMDAILPNIKMNHRDYGSLIRSAVDLAYDETYRKSNMTTGKIALQEGLETITRLMKEHLKLTDKDVRLEQNRIVLDKYLGLNGEVKSASQVKDFLEAAGNYLGSDLLNESKGFMIGQSGLAVSATAKWEDRHGSEAVGGEAKVRWGLKELDVINDRLRNNNIAGINTPSMHKWLTDASIENSVAFKKLQQNPDGKRMTEALTRTILENQGGQLRPGEVVIRTQANKGDFGANNDGGRSFAYTDDRGVIHVSADNFSDLPSASRKGGFQTVGDLQNTIITMHQNELPVDRGGTVADAINRNSGTALVELPQGMSHSHVRFISSELNKVGASDMAVMNELQKHEASIWRNIRELSATNSTKDAQQLRANLQAKVDAYHNVVAHIQSSSRDSSLAKNSMSVMMSNSGRFKIQGLNEAVADAAGYEEKTWYMSRQEVGKMIGGIETNVAEAMGLDLSHLDPNARGYKGTVGKLVLDNIERDGLYGFIGRYPTITTDTIQVSKVKIDPELTKRNAQGAYGRLATSISLKADYDGDFLNAVFAQYQVNDPQMLRGMHQEMKGIHAREQLEFMKALGKEGNNIAKDVSDELRTSDATVGKMATEEIKFTGQRGQVHNLESTTARVNASLIGRADNTRLKIWNLANTTYDVLSQNGLISAEEAAGKKHVLQEFGRALSQDFISSKKFDVNSIAEQVGASSVDDPRVTAMIAERQAGLATFMEGIMNPDHTGIEQMRKANTSIGLFKTDAEFNKMASAVQELHSIQGYTGNWIQNESLGLAVSEGKTPQQLFDILDGRTNSIVNTPYIQNYMNSIEGSEAMAGVRAHLQKGIDNNEQQIIRAWNKLKNPQMSFTEDTYQLGEEMLGASTARQTGVKMKDFAGEVFGRIGKSGTGFGAIGLAAGVFGGMWATSSLMRKTPTPEGNEAQQEGMAAPVPKSAMTGPSARIVPNEDVTIRISAKDASQMSADQISALVQSELNATVPMGVNMNLNLNDNTQNIDRGWLQGVMANAINFGNAF